ncbi:MAG TPA: hypothetical protein VM434_17545 [Beijerinckiaceae bacterium]|nr:hypothetical protein [Beijerinckiaceae bacterium]
MSKRADKPTIFVRTTASGMLAPVSAYDAEVLARYPVETVFRAEPDTKRDMALSAKLWCVLGRAVDNTDAFPDSRALCTALLIHHGYVQRTRLLGGGELVEPRSLTDFDKQEFETFYELAVQTICAEIIPGMSREALEADPRKNWGRA